jgi:ParB-like chromosome segregation protein Spo0J
MKTNTTDEHAQLLPLDKLIPDARNAKKHDERQIAQIAASIKEFGFANPIIIDEDNGILAGHGRWEAAHKLGLVEVPVRVIKGLTKAQKRAFIIADNKLTLNTGFDEERLKLEFEDMDESMRALTGFSDDEIKLCLDGWNSDIEMPEDKGDGDANILRVKVPPADMHQAKEAVSNALDVAGIEWEWIGATGN